MFGKIENLSKNHKKMTLKSKFGNLGKLVPTRKPTRLESSVKSSECRALQKGMRRHFSVGKPFLLLLMYGHKAPNCFKHCMIFYTSLLWALARQAHI